MQHHGCWSIQSSRIVLYTREEQGCLNETALSLLSPCKSTSRLDCITQPQFCSSHQPFPRRSGWTALHKVASRASSALSQQYGLPYHSENNAYTNYTLPYALYVYNEFCILQETVMNKCPLWTGLQDGNPYIYFGTMPANLQNKCYKLTLIHHY